MAYWSGDIQSAEKLYLYLANIEDRNPDVYGELGNVYYAQGEWKQAGQAYYEAAVRLLAINKGDQVNYLLQLIQGLDSDSAQLLRQKISG
jgi:tetratricopeptide (TPR) repeat protein